MEVSTLAFVDKLGFDTAAVVSTSPLILLLTGSDFRSVRDVQINGESVIRFELVSPRQLLVEPAASLGTSVTDIQVISSAPTATSVQSDVGVTLDIFGAHITGLGALAQRFLNVLLASKGSSYFEPTLGAGVRALAGTSAQGSFSDADLSAAVEATLEYLLDDPNYGALPVSEQIVAADVIESSWDKGTQKLTLKIKLTNAEGDSLVTTAGA